MSVRKVVDRQCVLDVPANSALARELEREDRNHDGSLDVYDFAGRPGVGSDQVRDLFHRTVAHALRVTGAVKNDAQENAVRRFFDVYAVVDAFDRATTLLDQSRRRLDNGVMTFGARDWEANARMQLNVEGEAGFWSMRVMANGLTRVFSGLAGVTPEDDSDDPKRPLSWAGEHKCDSVFGVTYAALDVPELLRPAVSHMVDAYVRSTTFVVQFDEAICDDDDCPVSMREPFLSQRDALSVLEVGAQFALHRTPPCASVPTIPEEKAHVGMQ